MDLWSAATEMVKMPDLDAMAADDDYIHTDTLRVTKKGSTIPPPLDGPGALDSSSSSNPYNISSVASGMAAPMTPVALSSVAAAATMTASTSWSAVPSTTPATAKPSTMPQMQPLQHTLSSPSSSSLSSWSLLDRKPPRPTASSGSSSQRIEEATARLNAMVFDTTTTTSMNETINNSSSHTNISSLQPTRTTSTSQSEASQTQSLSDDDVYQEDDDDASQDSYDDDDPIMSLLQKDGKGSSSYKSKPNHRFMNDLDQRLAKPSVPGDEQEATRNSLPQPLPVETTPQAPRKYWPWQKMTRPASASSSPSNKSSSPQQQDKGEGGGVGPLWALPKKKKPKQPAQDETSLFVKVSSGNLGFSDEEKQALASLKQQSTAEGDSGNIISDHPRESFVALTLVLGAAVYFFSRMTVADDLAL